MASFQENNFLRTYLSTDKALQIQNKSGKKVFTINVCNYQKSYISNNYLVILGEDSEKKYELDFANKNESIAAGVRWKTAVDILLTNCTESSVTEITTLKKTDVSYSEYREKQNDGTLNALSWYDISDTNNDLWLGSTIRVFCKSVNDAYPEGVALSTGAAVILDVLNDTVQKFELISQRILAENNSYVEFDSIANNIHLQNNSTGIITDSENIAITNKSSATVDSSSGLIIENSSIVIDNATNVKISNINKDLSSSILGFGLDSVSIDPNISLGKNGIALTSINVESPNEIVLQAYNNLIVQVFTFNVDNAVLDIRLSNKISVANSQFKIKLKLASGISNAKINVRQEIGDTVLYTLSDFHSESYVIFEYNKNTNLYEFVKIESSDINLEKRILLSPDNNGQTVFELIYLPTSGGKVKMYVNGQKLLFGEDFTFTSPNIITFLGTDYSLSTNDMIEFYVE